MYSFINSVLNQVPGVASVPKDMTGADLIAIIQTINTSADEPPLDNSGNTYVRTLFEPRNLGAVYTNLYLCFAPVVSNAMTFTAGGLGSGFASIAVAGYSGSSGQSVLDTNKNWVNATSIDTNFVTSGRLVIFGMGDAWTGTITATLGTVREKSGLIGSTAFAVGIGDIIGGLYGGLHTVWNETGGAADVETLIASFTPTVPNVLPISSGYIIG